MGKYGRQTTGKENSDEDASRRGDQHQAVSTENGREGKVKEGREKGKRGEGERGVVSDRKGE